VAKLQVTLQTDPNRPLVKRHTDDLEAYNLYLQGHYYWSRQTELHQAIACFEQAIARDALFALPHAGLASAYVTGCILGIIRPRTALEKGKLAAQEALRLDDELAEAHYAMGGIHFLEWNFVAAERELQQTIAINPSSGLPHAAFSHLLAC